MNDTNTKDAPKIYFLERDGVKLRIEREGRTGLLFLTLEGGGTLPEKYQGRYTTVPLVEQDANKYFEERRRQIDEALDEVREYVEKNKKVKKN